MQGFAWLFLTVISGVPAQRRRQRIGISEPAQWGNGDSMESDEEGSDCPFPVLPWALLLAVMGLWALYVLLTKKQRRMDRHPEREASQERALLRDVTCVLHVIRPRLWQIAQTQRKLHHFRDGSDIKGH